MINLELDQEQSNLIYNLLLQERRILYKDRNRNDSYPDKINVIYDLIEKLRILREQKENSVIS